MNSEQETTLKVLQTAIQMELDGREFYLKASQASTSELGAKLLRSLADEEELHRQKFEEIYQAIQQKGGWPEVTFQPDGGRNLRTIFAQALEATASATIPQTTELDAAQIALDMESQTYDFYHDRIDTATHAAEKEFYQALAAQEKEHQLILLDYYEFLKDPASWYVNKEHHSLDGG